MPFSKAVSAFPNPSSVRAMLFFMVCHYHNIVVDKSSVDKRAMREIFDFFVKILRYKNRTDIFCRKKNICHSSQEIARLITKQKWHKGSPELSRELGKIYLGASTLVNGLMNDWCTDNGIEVYGPYPVSRFFGSRTILVIREFPNLKPTSLWPHTKKYRYQTVKICTVYKNIRLRINFVGCHTEFSGDLADNLVRFSLLVDGRTISTISTMEKIAQTLIAQSSHQYAQVGRLDFESLKQKIIAQELYQLRDFFALVGVESAPHPLFLARVKNRQLIKKRYPLTTHHLLAREIKEKFGINDLIRLYSR